jgi:16S rRNA (guanine527-N7)-methyltransferase
MSTVGAAGVPGPASAPGPASVPGSEGLPGPADEPGEPGTAGAPSVAGPEPPAGALEIFGSVFPIARRYANILATDGIIRGLIGPHETARLWDRHLLNCAVVADLMPRRATLLDIGSGAGLPGIVLAMLLPEVQVTLLEPMARRVEFLDECRAALGLRNVAVRRGRAEEVRGQVRAEVVTARAVAPLDRLAGLAIPLVQPGGMVLALKGQRAAAEADAAGPVLRRLGVSDVAVLRAGVGKIAPPATVVRLIAGAQPTGSRGSARSTGARAGRRAGPGAADGKAARMRR